MEKTLVGLVIGVFVGALGYELLKKTKIANKAVQKVSSGLKSAKDAFKEGYGAVNESPGDEVAELA